MKILRAIGAFFAKIGRWIANTAWIQPLLIVGGIFGVIFSIPYIKDAVEKAQVDNTDYDYLYFQNRALGLDEGGRADKLFSYLESGTAEDLGKIKTEFASQFILTFVRKDSTCKAGVEGYKEFAAKFSSTYKFTGSCKIYTILVDKKNDDGEYLARKLVNNHQDFFDSLAGTFADENDKYVLYKNSPNSVSAIKEALDSFTQSTSTKEEGINAPFTFMFDYNMGMKASTDDGYRVNVSGVSAVFADYISLITESVTNKYTKGLLLRDCWGYQNVFDPDWEKSN